MIKQTSLDEVCNSLVELHRQRQDLHREEKSLTLRIKAKCRRLCDGDTTEADQLYKALDSGEHPDAENARSVCDPFLRARVLIHQDRAETEKRMREVAQALPVVEWVKQTRGFGLDSVAALIGETGNLANYPNPAKVWKRLGLAVIEGERQQKKTAAQEAIKHGYSPSRRSVVWNIGECLIKAGGYYADLYRKRKEVERQKAEAEGLEVVPSARLKDKTKQRSVGHIHNRAKRYMEKRLVRDLWSVWPRSD